MIKPPIFLNDQEKKIWRFSKGWVESSPPRIPVTTRILTCFFFGIPNGKPIICHDCIMDHGRGNPHPQEKRGKCQPELRRFMQSFWVPAWQRPVPYMQRPSLQTFTLNFWCLIGKNWHNIICTRKIRNTISEKCIASKLKPPEKSHFCGRYVTPWNWQKRWWQLK